MLCIVVYDIPETKIRTKVADTCLDYGLKRIQFSAFMGNLSRNRQEEMLLKMKRRVGKYDANIHLFAINEKDERLHKEVIVNGYRLGAHNA